MSCIDGTSTCRVYVVEREVTLPSQSAAGDDKDLLPLDVLKGISMEEKIRYLARWVLSDQDNPDTHIGYASRSF